MLGNQKLYRRIYGPILKRRLIKSVNIVSIKLLRELGIEQSHDYLEKFGFEKSRLPKDLSLALGSGNFSPIEMVRAYSVIANDGFISNIHFIDKIQDREGKNIFTHMNFNSQIDDDISAFPWLDTKEIIINRPYYLIIQHNSERVTDKRIVT